jgi:monothiol glutaredoxin
MMNRTFLLLASLLTSTPCTLAFSPAASSRAVHRHDAPAAAIATTTGHDARSAAPAAGTPLRMSDDVADDASSPAHERIRTLVESNSVLLFMKGSKVFPQCGFSNTACQILQSYGIDFHTVDVLADDEIRQGVKTFSQWPTIPQLYVCGEFIGGSDIMIEMYQNG